MTPVGHCATGMAAGGVIAPLIHRFFKTSYRALVVIFFISSILPDIDALSLLFSHRVYFGREWYSHHMAAHSVTGAAFFSLLLALLYLGGAVGIRGALNLFRKDKVLLEYKTRKFCGAFLASMAGCLTHFLGDMVTPPGPWGGIALAWPWPGMYGGWSRLYWHNWKIIYYSVLFIPSFIVAHMVAGGFSIFKNRFLSWTGTGLRIVAFLLSLVFLFNVYDFMEKNNYKEMGLKKWTQVNRRELPKWFLEMGDYFYSKAGVLWRQTLFSKKDMIRNWNVFIHGCENFHRTLNPLWETLASPSRGAEEDMKLFRFLQKNTPGMEDSRGGDYRVWVLRDIYPSFSFYDRAFIYYYSHGLRKNILQVSNAWMIVFRIEKRDSRGRALTVRRLFHSNKVFVPGALPPQINREEAKRSFYHLWSHDRIAYNLIPRSGLSVHRNLVRGFYPSLDTRYGSNRIRKWFRVLLHSGVWSAGCIVVPCLHLNLGSHVRDVFYPFWESADTIIDTRRPGSVFRGRKRIWGRVMFLRSAGFIFRDEGLLHAVMKKGPLR